MGKLMYDREQILTVMGRVVERTMRMDMTWDWPCGVAYYGIASAYEATGKKEYLDTLKERVDHMSGFYWGRANCWAAYTMSQVSHILPECYLYPAYLEIAGSLNEQLSCLKLYQTEHGLWRTLLDDEESYEEVSASAGIGAAMLLKKNPLYIKYINRTVEGLLASISEDGRVMNVSAGTAVMKDREGYLGISRKWIQGWGQGMALAFFAALLDYEKLGGDGAL